MKEYIIELMKIESKIEEEKIELVSKRDFNIEDAFKNGAVGCITDKEIESSLIEKFPNKVIIKVNNTVEAIQELAKYKRSVYNIPVIAVTGSVRKNKYKRHYC